MVIHVDFHSAKRFQFFREIRTRRQLPKTRRFDYHPNATGYLFEFLDLLSLPLFRREETSESPTDSN